jgi:hypothetical protein
MTTVFESYLSEWGYREIELATKLLKKYLDSDIKPLEGLHVGFNANSTVMIATVLSITLGAAGNGVVFASATSDEGGDTGDDSNSDDQDTEPEPEAESESEPSEPVAPEPPEARVTEPFSPAVPAEPPPAAEQEPEPLPCIPDKDPGCTSEPKIPCVDFDHPGCPEPEPEKKKPLPYCDKVGDDYTGSCHDRYDYDEVRHLS